MPLLKELERGARGALVLQRAMARAGVAPVVGAHRIAGRSNAGSLFGAFRLSFPPRGPFFELGNGWEPARSLEAGLWGV